MTTDLILTGTKKEKLVFNVCDGNLSISVIMPDVEKPVFTVNPHPEAIAILIENLEEVLMSDGGDERPVFISKYNIDTKKYVSHYKYILSKGYNEIYTIKFKVSKMPLIKIVLKIPTCDNLGYVLRESQRSAIKVRQVLAWFYNNAMYNNLKEREGF